MEENAQESTKRRKIFAFASHRWLQLGLLNVVFLVAPVGVWYYLHVQDRLEDNTIRLFRALREIDNMQRSYVRSATVSTDSSTDFGEIAERFKLAANDGYVAQLAQSLGVTHRVMPMSDDPVRTRVLTHPLQDDAHHLLGLRRKQKWKSYRY